MVNRIHQFPNALALRRVVHVGAAVLDIFQRLQGRTLDDRDLVAREIVAAQQFADFHFDQFQQLFVVHHIGLVHEDHDVRHANLTGEQDVLTGLGHRAVGSRHDQDSAVHLGSTGDHVLNIVSVAGAVHVSVVAGSRLVLNVSGVNRDAAGLFFRRLVDFVITHRLRFALLGQRHGDGGGQGRLAMVNVTDGADVNVGLFALVTFLSHWEIPSNLFVSYPAARRNPLGRRRENPVSKGDRRKITSSRVRR